MNKKPSTLLKHPALIDDIGVRIDVRPPELMRVFAEKWLTKYGIKTNKAFLAAMRSEDDPVLNDAAWLRFHAIRGLELIAKVPEELREVLRELWAHGFHAGERHESITVNLKHLKDVQASHERRTSSPARARRSRKPKITVPKYKDASSKARSRKELFSILNSSGQGVRDFETRHPELVNK